MVHGMRADWLISLQYHSSQPPTLAEGFTVLHKICDHNMSALLRDSTMYFLSENKCMMALNNVLVPDGHRYISGFQQNENVHYYTLVSIFCFALFLLYLNLPHVIMMSMILMVSSVIAAGRSHFHPQRHKVLKGKLTFVLHNLKN